MLACMSKTVLNIKIDERLKRAAQRRAEKTFSNVTAVVTGLLAEGLRDELADPASKAGRPAERRK
jgi:hypothetical protein